MAQIVTMTETEFRAAWDAGAGRHVHHAMRRGAPASPQAAWHEGVGAVAEAAVARLLGGTWQEGVGRTHYGSTDVVSRCGDKLEVKATHHAHGRVLIYTDTPDDARVVFAIVNDTRREVRVVGFLRAGDVKQDRWWRAEFKTPCFAVPQEMLTPIEEFPCSPPSQPSPDSPTSSS